MTYADKIRAFLDWKVPDKYRAESEWGSPKRGTVDEVAMENNAPFISTPNDSFSSVLYQHPMLGPMRVWYSYHVAIRYEALSEGLSIRDYAHYSNTTSRHQGAAHMKSPKSRRVYELKRNGDIMERLSPEQLVREYHVRYVESVRAALRARTTQLSNLRMARQSCAETLMLADNACVPYDAVSPKNLMIRDEKAHAKIIGWLMTDDTLAGVMANWPTN